MKQALYKVGDKVLVKSKWDNGYSGNNYRFGFVNKMLERFGGKVCTIESRTPVDFSFYDYDIKDDSFQYTLKEDRHTFAWASSMFESEF